MKCTDLRHRPLQLSQRRNLIAIFTINILISTLTFLITTILITIGFILEVISPLPFLTPLPLCIHLSISPSPLPVVYSRLPTLHSSPSLEPNPTPRSSHLFPQSPSNNPLIPSCPSLSLYHPFPSIRCSPRSVLSPPLTFSCPRSPPLGCPYVCLPLHLYLSLSVSIFSPFSQSFPPLPLLSQSSTSSLLVYQFVPLSFHSSTDLSPFPSHIYPPRSLHAPPPLPRAPRPQELPRVRLLCQSCQSASRLRHTWDLCFVDKLFGD